MAVPVVPTQPDAVSAVAELNDAITHGDATNIEQHIAATNDEQQAVRPGMARVIAAVGDFGKAAAERFGAAYAGKWGAAPAAVKFQGRPVPGQSDRADLLAGPASAQVVLPVQRQAGRWKLTLDGVTALMRLRHVDLAVPTDEPLRRLTDMAEAVSAVTADVKAKRLSSADAAAAAARAAIEDAARGRNAQ